LNERTAHDRAGAGVCATVHLVSTKPPAADLDDQGAVPDGWADLTEEEIEEIHREGDEAEAAFLRGEGIPAHEVVPRRFRRAG
jgi:hypothetical protein